MFTETITYKVNYYFKQEMLNDPDKRKALINEQRPKAKERFFLIEDFVSNLEDVLEIHGFQEPEIIYQLDEDHTKCTELNFKFKLIALDDLVVSSLGFDIKETEVYHLLIDHKFAPVIHYLDSIGQGIEIQGKFIVDSLADIQIDYLPGGGTKETRENRDLVPALNALMQQGEFEDYIESLRKGLKEVYARIVKDFLHQINSYIEKLDSEEFILQSIDGIECFTATGIEKETFLKREKQRPEIIEFENRELGK